MTEDEWQLRERAFFGLNPTGLVLTLVAALCFTGYLVESYFGPFVPNPQQLYFGVGGVFLVVGFVLIGLWRFFLGTALYARDARSEAVYQFAYLIGISAGVIGGFLLTGFLSDIGGGIQVLLLAYVSIRSDTFRLDPIFALHLGGACLSFFPTLWGLLPMNLYNLGLAAWILGLFIIWARNPKLGFEVQFQKPP